MVAVTVTGPLVVLLTSAGDWLQVWTVGALASPEQSSWMVSPGRVEVPELPLRSVMPWSSYSSVLPTCEDQVVDGIVPCQVVPVVRDIGPWLVKAGLVPSLMRLQRLG